jgi:hypothetical protein
MHFKISSPDITVFTVSPAEGLIPIGERVEISFSFNPIEKRATFRSQCIVNVAQESKVVELLGSAGHKVDFAEKHKERDENEAIGVEEVIQRNVPKRSNHKVGEIVERPETEESFDALFSRVQHFEDMKNTKVSRFVGEKLPTEDEIAKVLRDRAAAIQKDEEDRVMEARNRLFTRRYNSPVVSDPSFVPSFEGVMMRSSFRMRLAVIDRFNRAAAKVVFRVRAGKRLQQLKNMLIREGVKSKADCQAFVAKENAEAKLRPRTGSEAVEGESKPHWIEKLLLNSVTKKNYFSYVPEQLWSLISYNSFDFQIEEG